MAPFKWSGFKNFFLRLLLMPSLFFLFWIFYYDAFRDGMDENNQFQATFVTRNGLVFNSLAGAYFTAIIATATTCKTGQILRDISDTK